jgi:hypothetical protein
LFQIKTDGRKLDPEEIVTSEELLISEIIQSEALINLLDKKGLITKQELLEYEKVSGSDDKGKGMRQ